MSSLITFLDTCNFSSTKYPDISEAPKLELKCTRKNTRPKKKKELLNVNKRNNCPTYFLNYCNCSYWSFSALTSSYGFVRGIKMGLSKGTYSSPHTCGHSPLCSPNQRTQAQFLPSLGATLAPASANSTKEVAATGHPFSRELNCAHSQVENVPLQAKWQAAL